MSRNDRLELLDQRLPSMLTELAAPSIPDYAYDVLAQTAATRQRPRWAIPERWLPMGAIARPMTLLPRVPVRAVMLGALVIVLLVGALLVGAAARKPAPIFGLARNGPIMFDHDGDLFSMDLATAQTTSIPTGEGDDFGGWYSLDGSRFVFLRRVAGTPGKSDERVVLHIAAADGSGDRALTPPLVKGEWFDVSPDGSQVVYQANEDGRVMLHLVATDGRSKPRLFDLPMIVELPSWLPDGHLVYFRATKDIGGGQFRSALMTIDPSTGETHQLTAFNGDKDGGYRFPTASPDGRFIAFTQWKDYEQRVRLHVLDLAGGIDHELTLAPGHDGEGYPSFSPDGKLWVFKTFDDPNTQMQYAPVDGSAPPKLAGPIAGDLNAGFSPDGTKIIVNDPNAHQTWLVDVATGGLGTLVTGPDGAQTGWQRLAP
jgi:Tol biopolymer transport system component